MTVTEQNIEYVLRFFKSWEKGSYNDLRQSYREFLAADVLYQNSGVPDCDGIDAALALIDSVCLLDCMKIQSIRVKLLSICANREHVFTERIDYHYNTAGDAVLVPRICGVMEFRNGKIVRWADYYDPIPMVQALNERTGKP
jgi:limonene-1,2-epoxide hydrolase